MAFPRPKEFTQQKQPDKLYLVNGKWKNKKPEYYFAETNEEGITEYSTMKFKTDIFGNLK